MITEQILHLPPQEQTNLSLRSFSITAKLG
jgi:hypothetical protein